MREREKESVGDIGFWLGDEAITESCCCCFTTTSDGLMALSMRLLSHYFGFSQKMQVQ